MKEIQVNYKQLGTSEDLDDWFYTKVIKNIVDKEQAPLQCNGSGTPNKSFTEIVKDLTALIPDGRTLAIEKSTYRNKITYSIGDAKDTHLSLSYTKKEKTETCEYFFLTAFPEVVVDFEKYAKTTFVNDKKNNIYVVGQSDSGLYLHSLGPIDAVLERDNYPQTIMDGYDHIVSEFSKPKPFGRLAVFNGPPGTGKTYLLRSLISHMKDCLVVLLPSKLVGEVDSPSLITLLANEKSEYGSLDPHGDGKNTLPILFIIEDADACLVPRQSDNVLTISSLLNYTDGILGSMLDMRVVATTNQESIEFDEALTRPGRMCRHVNVGNLSPEHAAEIYARITNGKKKVYDKKVSLAQVYADANGLFEEAPVIKKSLGFL